MLTASILSLLKSTQDTINKTLRPFPEVMLTFLSDICVALGIMSTEVFPEV